MATAISGRVKQEAPIESLDLLSELAQQDPTSSSRSSTMTGVHQTMSDRLVAATEEGQLGLS
jgi:hypothetical protein